MKDIKETRPSKYNRIDRNMNSQRLRHHAQGLHGSAPDGILEPKEEVDTCPKP